MITKKELESIGFVLSGVATSGFSKLFHRESDNISVFWHVRKGSPPVIEKLTIYPPNFPRMNSIIEFEPKSIEHLEETIKNIK